MKYLIILTLLLSFSPVAYTNPYKPIECINWRITHLPHNKIIIERKWPLKNGSDIKEFYKKANICAQSIGYKIIYIIESDKEIKVLLEK